MAIEKTHRDKHAHAALQLEGLLGLRPPPSPAEYQRRYDDEPETGPVLYCGAKVVVRVTRWARSKRVVAGYLLARVVAWEENAARWGYGTCVYLVAERATTSELDDRVGQLSHAYVARDGRTRYGYFGGSRSLEIVSFDAADLPRRIAPDELQATVSVSNHNGGE